MKDTTRRGWTRTRTREIYRTSHRTLIIPLSSPAPEGRHERTNDPPCGAQRAASSTSNRTSRFPKPRKSTRTHTCPPAGKHGQGDRPLAGADVRTRCTSEAPCRVVRHNALVLYGIMHMMTTAASSPNPSCDTVRDRVSKPQGFTGRQPDDMMQANKQASVTPKRK